MVRGDQKGISSDATPSRVAETTPPSYPMSDYSFTLQAIMEMQKTLGQLTQAVSTLTEESKKNGSTLNDISQKIYAAKVVLWIMGGFLATTSGLIVFFLNKFWDKISLIKP